MWKRDSPRQTLLSGVSFSRGGDKNGNGTGCSSVSFSNDDRVTFDCSLGVAMLAAEGELMSDFAKKATGVLLILFICGLSSMAIMVNQESGPPAPLEIREVDNSPSGDSGCIPVCGSVITLLAVLIIRGGLL